MADTVVSNEGYQAEDLTVASALQQLFKACKTHNKLSIGSSEVIKALYRNAAPDSKDSLKLVVMAKDSLTEFFQIIEEKCKELNIPMILLETKQDLAKITPVKKIKKNTAIGVKDFVCESREKAFIVNAYKN